MLALSFTPAQQNLSHSHIALWLKYFALITGFFMAASVAWAQKLDVAPELKIGDKWTYKFTNIGDRREPYTFTLVASEITADSVWLHGETADPNATEKKYIWRYDIKRADTLERFSWDDSAANKRGNRAFDALQKSNDFYKFPLEVGKKWEIKEHWGSGQGHTDWKAEVVAFEKVKTEAGEFDAFKIQYRGFWNRTSNGSGSDRAELDRWYAPAAKRFIKSSYMDRSGGRLWNQNSTELVKWEPAIPAQVTAPAQTPASAPTR
jgi:hypothetical protein